MNKHYIPPRLFYLYILRLEHGCYYVGITRYTNATKRIEQHTAGKGGALWTKLHKPIETLEVRNLGCIYESEALYFENLETYNMIGKYGLEKVRGGKLCTLNIRKLEADYMRNYPSANKKPRSRKRELKEMQYQEELARELNWATQ